MKKTPFVILLLLSPIILSYPAESSNTYYVSTSIGDDNNTGTFTEPWKTIQKAADSVTEGDAVFIRAGTYYEEVFIQNKHGTKDAWITFKPYNNEAVIVDGRNIPNKWNHSIFKTTNASYIHITGFNILNSAWCGFWINAVADWILIDNNTIMNCSSNGIYTETSAPYTITNISFHHNIVDNVNNNWSLAGGSNGEGVSFRNVQYFNISYNQISRCGKECIDTKNGSAYGDILHNSINTSTWDDDPGYFPPGIWNHIGIYCDAYNERNHHINISCNYVYGNHGQGIVAGVEKPTGSLDNIRIFNNIVNITWINASGISIVNYSGTEVTISNISIFSNTVTTTKDYSLDIQADTLIENIRIENNIFTTYNSTIIRIKNYNPTSIIILKNNLFYNNTGPPHNQWNGTWDVSWGENAIVKDPELESNFSLRWGSPAIDNGITVPILYDYVGNQRPYGLGFDIGAFEYSANYPTIFGVSTPANESIGNLLNFIWSIPINDLEGDLFSWTIQCSNRQVNSGTNDTNGTKVLPLSHLAYASTYQIWVNATDSTGSCIYTRNWYMFTTRDTGAGPPPEEPPQSSNQPPIADVSAGEPYKGLINTMIFFDGSRSSDPDGNITKWLWVFGDNTNGSGKTVLHTYSKTGTYTMTLTVIDDEGANNTNTTICMITDTKNRPPIKPTITGPSNGTTNISYIFTAVSTDPDNDTIRYSFNWGDQTSNFNTSTFLPSNMSFTCSHRWSTPGQYNLTVVVTDNQTESSTQYTITIEAEKQDPQIPGFEAVFLLYAIMMILLLWKKKQKI